MRSSEQVETRELKGPTKLKLPGYSEAVEFGYLYSIAYPISEAHSNSGTIFFAHINTNVNEFILPLYFIYVLVPNTDL